jgi:hypothetical protein
MAYEAKPNSGTLFKNDRKQTEKHPDYTGSWKDANGKEWQLAAWVKPGKKGNFLSISASEKQTTTTAETTDLPF